MNTPESKTPSTLRCWRDGKWHADELANLAAKQEEQLTEAKQTIARLESDMLNWASETEILRDKLNSMIVVDGQALACSQVVSDKFNAAQQTIREQTEAIQVAHTLLGEKDREIRELKQREQGLRDILDDCVNGGVDCKCDFYGGICNCYTDHINKALFTTPTTSRTPSVSAETVRELQKYKDRMDWLHSGGGSNDTDEEGYEWGVARVKFNQFGDVVSVQWTASDHSDLDKEMARTRAEAEMKGEK